MTIRKNKPLNPRSPCTAANSILEADLAIAVQQHALKKLCLAETPIGFYVVVQLKWSQGKEWYLTTRRERTRPRLFKDLKRLNELLKATYPTDSIELLRNQDLPGHNAAKAGARKTAKGTGQDGGPSIPPYMQ